MLQYVDVLYLEPLQFVALDYFCADHCVGGANFGDDSGGGHGGGGDGVVAHVVSVQQHWLFAVHDGLTSISGTPQGVSWY